MEREMLSREVEALVAQACDPSHYDSGNVAWIEEGSEESPSRVFFRTYIREYLGDLSGKSIVDIGCGTGHLVTLFPNAKRFLGIEPSQTNVDVAHEKYPTLDIVKGTLEECDIHESFDVALAIMSFEHVRDLASGFRKVAGMLEPGAVLCLITFDFSYIQTPRFNHELTVLPVGEGEIVVKLKRDYGTLCDMARTPERICAEAKKAGFALKQSVPMPPTDALIAAKPKYEKFRGVPMNHMYIFENGGLAMK